MLTPHWLDGRFEESRQKDQNLIVSSEIFQKAFRKAMKKYEESEKYYEENPDAYGASPAQEARLEFLEILSAPQAKWVDLDTSKFSRMPNIPEPTQADNDRLEELDYEWAINEGDVTPENIEWIRKALAGYIRRAVSAENRLKQQSSASSE